LGRITTGSLGEGGVGDTISRGRFWWSSKIFFGDALGIMDERGWIGIVGRSGFGGGTGTEEKLNGFATRDTFSAGGGFISTIAGTATSLTIRASGREIS
jgi:hypothetical protein